MSVCSCRKNPIKYRTLKQEAREEWRERERLNKRKTKKSLNKEENLTVGMSRNRGQWM